MNHLITASSLVKGAAALLAVVVLRSGSDIETAFTIYAIGEALNQLTMFASDMLDEEEEGL